jgi:flagellar motor switch protein FliM
MADPERILSQSEVDALLSAIDSGDVEVVPASSSAPQAVPFDFRRPDRLGPERLVEVERRHEGYARALQEYLGAQMRSPVAVRIVAAREGTGEGIAGELPDPGVMVVLTLSPGGHRVVLEYSPAIVHPLLERLQGASKLTPPPARALTPIEWSLVEGISERVASMLAEAWTPAAFRVAGREAHPRAVTVAAPGEPVVAVAFEIALGELRGTHHVILPAAVARARTGETRPGPAAPGAAPPELSGRMAAAEVRLAAQLPTERMRLWDVARLRPGSILVTGHAAAAPVELSVEGRPKFRARVGSLRDHKAVMVVGPAEPPAAGRPPVVVRSDSDTRDFLRRRSSPDASMGVPLEVSVVLAEKPMRLEDVLSVRVDQVLEFPRGADESLVMRIAGQPCASGIAVRVGERFGLQITHLLHPPPGAP